MAITIEAKAAGKQSLPGDPGEPASIDISPPADVELVVTAPKGTDPVKAKLTKDGADVTATFAAGAETATTVELSTTLADLTEDQLGTYTATIEGGDSASLVITKTATTGNGTTPAANGVLELEPGVYDEAFARTTGIAAAVAGGAFILIALLSLLRFPLQAEQVTVASGWVTNTLAERVAGAVQLLALGLGAVMLVIGGWQAALEVRGRLTLKVTARGGDPTRAVAPADLGEAVAKVLEVLRGARGTIATLAVGALVVLGALWSAASVASSSHGPQPVPSSSPSPTTPPTSPPPASPAPSPATSPSPSPTS